MLSVGPDGKFRSYAAARKNPPTHTYTTGKPLSDELDRGPAGQILARGHSRPKLLLFAIK